MQEGSGGAETGRLLIRAFAQPVVARLAEVPAGPLSPYGRALRTMLVSVDVGNTLLRLDGPGLATRVLAAVGEPHRRERLRGVLLTGPFQRSDLPAELEFESLLRTPVTQAVLEPDTEAALQELMTTHRVVTLSNTTALDTAARDPLTTRFPSLSRYRSCELGHAKPDARAFNRMLRDEGVLAAETVHIGDSWNCDVLGATAAGLRAIWISSQPMPHRSPEGLVGVAPDFPAAVALLRQEDRDRPR